MFGRLLWQLLHANRGRLAVALVALISGAAVISALINLDLDVGRKMTEEFRTLGANLVVEPPRAASPGPQESALMDGQALRAVEASRTPELVAAAPFLYLVARTQAEQPVVLAGTWLDQMRQLEPWWKVEGEWLTSRGDLTHCIVGVSAARQLKLTPGDELKLRSGDRSATLVVAGIATAGGTEDSQVFANLPVVQELAGLAGKIGVVQLSVKGSGAQIDAYAKRLGAAVPALEVRPIRQVTEAEGQLLGRIQLLIFAMVILILVLTLLCVLATMAALAMERRTDVGLMKAIGGSISRVVGLFLAEVGVLGLAGGVAGYFAGIELSRWMGRRVFGAAISARPEVLPLTAALMVAVALLGALPLRLLGKVRPAVILRGE